MLRLLADENFPFPVVDALRRSGHDVVTLADLGVAGQSLTDPAVLKLSSDNGRALMTLNRRDFVRLHRASADHAGIVVCSFDLDFERQAARIRVAIAGRSSLSRQLIRVNRGSAAS